MINKKEEITAEQIRDSLDLRFLDGRKWVKLEQDQVDEYCIITKKAELSMYENEDKNTKYYMITSGDNIKFCLVVRNFNKKSFDTDWKITIGKGIVVNVKHKNKWVNNNDN